MDGRRLFHGGAEVRRKRPETRGLTLNPGKDGETSIATSWRLATLNRGMFRCAYNTIANDGTGAIVSREIHALPVAD